MKALYDLEKREIFEKALPRTKEDERTFLSADLKEHGCMNPIITYHGAIIDGHTRYDICHEFGIPFEVEEMEFEDDIAALLWVLRNQLGRRNLSTFEKCELVLPLEEQLRKEAKERQGTRRDLNNFVEIFPQSEVSAKTRDILGAMAGVIGCLQALEAIKFITGTGKLLTGTLLTFDALDMNFHKINLPKRNHDCAVCGDNPTITELTEL